MLKIIYLPDKKVLLSGMKQSLQNMKPIISMSGKDTIFVPPNHLLCVGYFYELVLYLHCNGIEFPGVETGFTRNDFLDEEPDYVDFGKFYFVISIEKLETLGLEIKTGEGWGWNPQTLENEFCESADTDHKWNSFSKKWEKVCDKCSKLPHLTENYNLVYYVTEDHLFGGNEGVLFCEYDRCSGCLRFRYIDPYGHSGCERRD
jgi:hypothetical protein